MSTTKIVLNRQSDLILTGATINAPKGLSKKDIAELVDDLQKLNLADSAEAIARAEGDADLKAALKDAEKELNDAIKKGDADLLAALEAYQASNDSALASETESRMAGDRALQSSLDATNASMEAADAGLANDIEAIEVEHAADVVTLQANIDNEQSRAEAAEGVLRTDLAKEVSDRIADVDAEQLRATKEEDAIKASLTAEVTRATTEEDAIKASLTAEATRATAAEGVLQSNIDVETSRIDAILLASDADKDSFAEIVSLINSVDTENDEAFASYVLSNNAALAAEEDARELADANLASDLADEVVRAMNAESDLASDISEEVVRATAAEDAIKASLSSEVSRATAAEEAIATDLATEITNRTSADTAFTNSLNNEIADRIAGDQTVQTNLDNEVTRAEAAEGVLRTDLNTEISDRISAVSAEEAARIAGDADGAAALADQRELMFANFNTTNSNLNNLVDSSEAADALLQSNIDAELERAAAAEAAITIALEEEVVRAEAAEADLQSNLDSEIARAEAAEGDIGKKLEATKSEITKAYELADKKLQDGIDSEAKDRTEADKKLQDGIDSEAKDRTEADKKLQSNIDTETKRIDAILDGSTVDLDQFKEVVAFVESIDMKNDDALLTAVTDIKSSIDAESAIRESGDIELMATLDKEVERAEGVEGDIITMVGYKDMNKYTASLYSEFERELSNAFDTIAKINESIDFHNLSITEFENVLNDVNTVYPVEITFSSGDSSHVNTFNDSAELVRTIDSYYEKNDSLENDLNYWSNIDGEANLTNFDGWLELRADRKMELLGVEVEEAYKDLDSRINDIISNVDITAIDSFSEVITNVDAALATVNEDAADYVIQNRPTMTEFNESPEMIDSGELDENEEPIMVLRDTFSAPVILGTHIVFLNGLMQFEGRDYDAVISIVRPIDGGVKKHTETAIDVRLEQSLVIEFYNAPEATDVLNVYGVITGTKMNPSTSLSDIKGGGVKHDFEEA
jgi:hypothetical protein